jgi:hypothetical protein
MVVEFYLVFVVIPLYPLCNFLNYTQNVKALYPSVPRKETMIACEKALQKRKNPFIPTVCV